MPRSTWRQDSAAPAAARSPSRSGTRAPGRWRGAAAALAEKTLCCSRAAVSLPASQRRTVESRGRRCWQDNQPMHSKEACARTHRPVVQSGCAQNLEHSEDLVDVVGAGKKGRAGQQLGHHGAHGPHIHRGSVPPGPKQQFWGAIPPWYDTGSRQSTDTCRPSFNFQ